MIIFTKYIVPDQQKCVQIWEMIPFENNILEWFSVKIDVF